MQSVSKQENQQWNDEVDVIVVGFGGAGACAALEAAQQAASVLVLDRFLSLGSSVSRPRRCVGMPQR